MSENNDFESARECFQRGVAFLQSENYIAAETEFRRSLKFIPNRTSTLINISIALLKSGNIFDAKQYIDVAYKQAPENPSILNQLGLISLKMDKSKEALHFFEMCLRADKNYSEAYINRGDALSRLSDTDGALQSYHQALELNKSSIEAFIARGKLYSELGKFDEAMSDFESALSINPESVDALVEVAKIKKFDAKDALISNYQDVISSGSVANSKKVKIYHCLGKIYNDLEDHERAFHSFKQGKALINTSFDIDRHAINYSRFRSLFTTEFFAQRQRYGIDDNRHIFIVGMPRSGTTLVEQILASHHAVEGMGELQTLPRLILDHAGDINDGTQFEEKVRSLNSSDIEVMADRYRSSIHVTKPSAIMITDKRPHNYELLGFIALMFPKSFIIDCRRDPLDNCCALYMQNFNEHHGYNNDLTTLGRYYQEYNNLMSHWNSILPLKIFRLDYESLVLDIEKSVKELLNFLDLEWDEACLKFDRQSLKTRTLSLWQVRQPIYTNSIGRSKKYGELLIELKNALEQDKT